MKSIAWIFDKNVLNHTLKVLKIKEHKKIYHRKTED